MCRIIFYIHDHDFFGDKAIRRRVFSDLSNEIYSIIAKSIIIYKMRQIVAHFEVNACTVYYNNKRHFFQCLIIT